MNTSLITGFVVGGMLLVTLLAFSMRVSQNAGMTTLNQITKFRVESIAQITASDLQKIGQGIDSNQILTAQVNRIRFRTQFAIGETSTVEWRFFPDQPIEETENPRDRLLVRIVDSDTTFIRLGVSRFDITYFDQNGNPTFVADQIRRVRVQLMCESDAPFGNDFARSYWEQDFTPRAIQ